VLTNDKTLNGPAVAIVQTIPEPVHLDS